MPPSTDFPALHQRPEAFVLPNVWDAGSAKVLARAGFPALGRTSAGIAFSAGLPDDGSMGRDRMVERISDIAAAVERAARYSNAGADCVFVPGPSDAATIGRLAEAIEAPLTWSPASLASRSRWPSSAGSGCAAWASAAASRAPRSGSLSEPRRRCSTGASTSPADALAHAEVNRLMAG